MKKKLIKIGICVLICFFGINIFWFTWNQIKYAQFSAAIPEKNKMGVRMLTDEDGFDFGVKEPGYLSFTGNLSIVMPSEGDEISFNDGLIVWPKAFGGFEYGVILYEPTSDNESIQYQIYIDEEGNAIESDEETALITKKHKDSINILLEKANEMWDLQS